MKANELMIGDWVQGNPCGQHCDRNNNIYYKIAVLDIGNHCWGYSVCGALVELKYDDVFPIPLTPEILEKNGFVLESYSGNVMSGKWWTRNDFVIHENMNDSVGKNNFKYEYVHQLQHALWLCGIEKEIIL